MAAAEATTHVSTAAVTTTTVAAATVTTATMGVRGASRAENHEEHRDQSCDCFNWV
jgi:hypothetical protein